MTIKVKPIQAPRPPKEPQRNTSAAGGRGKRREDGRRK